MKKLLFLSITLAALTAQAQSVDRNDVVISASPGVTINIWENNAAANYHLSEELGLRAPITVEYVFARYFGISGDFVYTRLVSLNTLYPSNFRVLDFGVSLQLHSPSADRLIHWTGAIGFHYSRFHYFHKRGIEHETYDAGGTALYYAIGANTYFSSGGKLGIGLLLNGSSYNYPITHYTNNYGGDSEFKMNGMALSLGVNIFYKI